MENATEFDLNHAIRNWRQHLSQSPSYRAENLEELESHLRDSVATLTGKGLSEEEAFLIATRRVGAPRTLEPEYAKVNGKEIWLSRLLWMLVGIQVWGLIGTVSGAISRTGSQFLVSLMPDPGIGLGVISQVLYGRTVSAIPGALYFLTDIALLAAVIAGCWRLVRRAEPRLSEMLRRPGLFACGIAALCFAYFAGGALSWMGNMWTARTVDAETYGKIVMSMSVASMALFVLKTVALAIFTVLLVRWQLRRAAA